MHLGPPSLRVKFTSKLSTSPYSKAWQVALGTAFHHLGVEIDANLCLGPVYLRDEHLLPLFPPTVFSEGIFLLISNLLPSIRSFQQSSLEGEWWVNTDKTCFQKSEVAARKRHNQGGLNNTNLFLIVWRPEVPRSRWQHIQRLKVPPHLAEI